MLLSTAESMCWGQQLIDVILRLVVGPKYWELRSLSVLHHQGLLPELFIWGSPAVECLSWLKRFQETNRPQQKTSNNMFLFAKKGNQMNSSTLRNRLYMTPSLVAKIAVLSSKSHSVNWASWSQWETGPLRSAQRFFTKNSENKAAPPAWGSNSSKCCLRCLRVSQVLPPVISILSSMALTFSEMKSSLCWEWSEAYQRSSLRFSRTCTKVLSSVLRPRRKMKQRAKTESPAWCCFVLPCTKNK